MHIAYCWELGRGFGHVTRMNQIANDESLANCTFSFILRELNHASVIQKCHVNNIYQAPKIDFPVKGFSPNFSHLMMRCGWQNEEAAVNLFSAWKRLFDVIKPDIVILDHAPSAGLAALFLDIPIRLIGNGFEIPPATSPMPAMQMNLANDTHQLKAVDEELNQVFDRVEHRVSGQIQQRLRLAHLFTPEHSLIMGSPLLDHYGGRCSDWRYLPLLTQPNQARQDLSVLDSYEKPKLFCYLEARTPNLLALLDGLSQHFTVFGYINHAEDTLPIEALKAKGVHLFDSLLDIEQALDMADFVVCHSGVGVIGNVLEKQLPMLLLPMQLEQNMVAYQLHNRQLAWVVSPTQPLEKWMSYIPSWIEAKEKISLKISSESKASALVEKYWSGNLYHDFLNT